LAKYHDTSQSVIPTCGVCAGGNKWRTTRTAARTNTGQGHALLSLISTGYGTVTGELHPPPHQGNARLTYSTTAPLNIIDRPVFTFTNIITAPPSTSSGRWKGQWTFSARDLPD